MNTTQAHTAALALSLRTLRQAWVSRRGSVVFVNLTMRRHARLVEVVNAAA